jgi:hypothetical protein
MAGATTPWNIPTIGPGDTIPSLEGLINPISTATNTALSAVQATAYTTYATLAALSAVPGTVVGQHASVNNDTTATNNGDYAWTGSAWIPVGNGAFTVMGAPTWGTGYSFGPSTTNWIRKQGTRVTIQAEIQKSSAMSGGDTILTFAAGFRPAESINIVGWGTSGAEAGVQGINISSAGVMMLNNSSVGGTNVWLHTFFETV